MTQYYVVGGLYADTHFTHLAPGQREVRQGPFDSYEAARKAWQSLAWESVDDALVHYHIEEAPDAGYLPDGLEVAYWVFGGRYLSTRFDELASTPERYGPYPSYEAAHDKWQQLAWESVDDATAKYRIETLRQKKAVSEAPLAYRLLTGPDDRQFCERVSQALKEGYRLHGTPSLTTNSAGQVIVGQALVLATD